MHRFHYNKYIYVLSISNIPGLIMYLYRQLQAHTDHDQPNYIYELSNLTIG